MPGCRLLDEEVGLMVEQKRCCRCGELMPIDEFYSSGHYSDGLLPWCAQCDLDMLVMGTEESHRLMKQYGDAERLHRDN